MELEFSRQIFEKCSNIKFHGNPPSEMDGHDKGNNLFSQFAKPRQHTWQGHNDKGGTTMEFLGVALVCM